MSSSIDAMQASAARKLDKLLDADTEAALRRIRAYTPTEQAEAAAGLRETEEQRDAREAVERALARLVELRASFAVLGKAIRAMYETFGVVLAGIAEGFRGGGRP